MQENLRTIKNYKPTEFKAPGYVYRKRMADAAVLFVNNLRHGHGDWHGMPFIMMDWQEQIIRDLFGIVSNNADLRQFKQAYIEIPKKNGKSELAAAIALLLTCCDFEYGGFVYGCATDRQQASIVFDVALNMVDQFPELKRYFRLQPTIKRMTFLPLKSYYQVVSAESANKDGYNAHGIIFDELHAQKNREFYDKITSGSGLSRKQPLTFIITTAGFDRNSICWKLHRRAQDIIDKKITDPTFYPVIYGAKDEDDWQSEAVWRRVNPSYGTTVMEEQFAMEYAKALTGPAEENIFRRQNLNQWVKQYVRWMPMNLWDACDFKFREEDLRGRDCYGGLDLAGTTDMTSFVLIFPPRDESDKYIILPHYWIPRENLHERVKKDKVPYDDWLAKGFLTATDGEVIDYNFVQKKIDELGKRYKIQQIGFDEWGAYQMMTNLKNAGFEVVGIRQSFQGLSNPSKELYRIVRNKIIAHNGHPILRWNFDNVMIKTDEHDNIRPDKKKSSERIDGAVATIMALECSIKHRKSKGALIIIDLDSDSCEYYG